jgi:hypothetical protein
VIEFLASVEPASLPLLAVLAFSASLIPVGLMLGSPCSPCCGCSACTEGSLPSTVTVTLDGFPDTRPGPTLLGIVASSCTSFTSAIGVARAPSGQGPPGPITSVDVTDGGSNFAVLGRVEPQLTITGTGTGATFTPTFSTSQNVCGIPTWSIESIAVSGGSGYTDEESLVITASDDDTVLQDATAILYLDKAEPTLTLVGSATATVAVVESFDGGWAVDSVTVTNGGSGYTEGDALTFVGGDDTIEVVAAAGFAQVEHDEPIPTVFINSPGGINAVLTPIWEVLPPSGPFPHMKTYRLVGFTVDNGGSGYQQFEWISILLQDVNNGQVLEDAFIVIDSVDGNGAIQAVFVAPDDNNFNPGPAGRYVGSRTDRLDSVAITNGGNYYDDVPGSITVRVATPGEYYREDPDEPPYVSEVSIFLTQAPPSAGDGATFEAIIDTDTSSESFGSITAFTVTNGGDGYLEFGDILLCCGEFYNGRTFVLKRSNTVGPVSPQAACVFQHRFCGVHNQADGPGIVRVTYAGPGSPPTVQVVAELGGSGSSDRIAGFCGEVMTADFTVSDCDDFQFTASNDSGATATVQPGGDYDPDDGYAGERSCFICCKGESQPPEEITVSWVKNADGTIPSGNYVLPRGVRLLSIFGIQLLRSWSDSGTFSDFGLAVAVRPCSNEVPIGSGRGYLPIVLDGDETCDECHRSCITYALVDEDLGGKSLSLETATCSDCEETPVCSPKPGAYETVFGTLTIS